MIMIHVRECGYTDLGFVLEEEEGWKRIDLIFISDFHVLISVNLEKKGSLLRR